MKNRQRAFALKHFVQTLATQHVFCRGCQLAVTERESRYNSGFCAACGSHNTEKAEA